MRGISVPEISKKILLSQSDIKKVSEKIENKVVTCNEKNSVKELMDYNKISAFGLPVKNKVMKIRK